MSARLPRWGEWGARERAGSAGQAAKTPFFWGCSGLGGLTQNWSPHPGWHPWLAMDPHPHLLAPQGREETRWEPLPPQGHQLPQEGWRFLVAGLGG